MLNIPEEIKELLLEDGTRKNFRVHFPNGEREDITNENIVEESVVLSESLSSELQLTFGLCDMAELEFEVCGIENIKGCIIECTLEVYCNVETPGCAYKEDINANVYPIPYGTFLVFSCKKQGDMTRRTIIAYGGNTMQGNQLPKSVINGLKNAIFPNPQKKISFDTILKCLKPELITNRYHTMGPSDFLYSSINIYDKDGKYITYVRITYAPFSVFSSESNTYEVVAFKPTYETNPRAEQLIALLKEKIADIKRQGGYSSKANIEVGSLNTYYSTISPTVKVETLNPVPYYDYSDIDDVFNVEKMRYAVALDWGNGKNGFSTAMQMRASGGSITYTLNYVYVPYMFSFEDGTEIELGDSFAGYSGFGCYYTRLPLFSGKNEPSVSTTYVQRTKNETTAPMTYILSKETITQKWTEYIKAYYELQGAFGTYARDGMFKVFTINNESVETILKSGYSSLWYDDEYCKEIGAIYIQYNDDNNVDVSETVELVSDYNDKLYRTYDMTGNAIIDYSRMSDNAIIETLVTAGKTMQGIKYMPTELTAKGMPWLEVGDIITVETENEGNITVLVEKRTLTGIQHIQDEIECVDEEQIDMSTVGFDVSANTIIIGG